jgi:hypothetical protein
MNILNRYIIGRIDKYLSEIENNANHDSLTTCNSNIVIDSFGGQDFTYQENMFIWSKLQEKGFLKLTIPTAFVKRLGDSLLCKIKDQVFSDESILAGYSIPVTQYFNDKDIRILRELGTFLCKQESIRQYIFMPSIVGIEASYSRFSNSAKPTHAFLWHRDADCHLNQLKLMIPLVECDEVNGMFSAISREACNREDIYRDLELCRRYSLISNDDYRRSDCLYRLTDKTARDCVRGEYFYDFKNKIGEALLVDTNNCYHKGGLVMQEGKFRLLIQITLGSFIHTWHEDKFNLMKKLRATATEYVVKRVPTRGVNDVYIGNQ